MSGPPGAEAAAAVETAASADQPQPVAASTVATWWVLAVCVAAAVIAAGLQVWSGQRQYGFYLLALCFLVCLAGAWLDLATRRIPNVLTYPAILIGLTLNALAPPALEAAGADTAVVWLGATGLRDGLLGFGLCAAIGIVSFMARGLGGGDVKLLGAVGAMLGFDAVIAVLFNTLLVAALIGLANWVLKGTLMARAQIIANNVLIAVVTKRRVNVY
ncbi:MAG: prepilin peptidase, partial [Planctomycetota bacterium]